MKVQDIKVIIADDHELIREGLKKILSFEEDISIVAEASNGEEALELLLKYDVNIVLLDFNMPKMNGLEVLKILRLRNPELKVIMLTIENDRKTIHEAIEIGADGYMLKDSAGKEIVNAVRLVSGGEKYLDKSLVSMLFSDIKKKDVKKKGILDNLSKRELEILIHISKGLSNKEIGRLLFISEKTVKNYATNLFKKINLDDRVKATIFAIENEVENYYKDKFV